MNQSVFKWVKDTQEQTRFQNCWNADVSIMFPELIFIKYVISVLFLFE